MAADKANKMMASQCTEMMSRLADVEAMALRHGKKIIAKLEERCRALEDELGKINIIENFLLVRINYQYVEDSIYYINFVIQVSLRCVLEMFTKEH